MNNKSAINEQVDKYLREVKDLLVVIISDYEGVHIYNAAKDSVKDKLQKIIQTSTMLICTICQSEGNFQKVNMKK